MNRTLTRQLIAAPVPPDQPAWVAPLYRPGLATGQRACCCSAIATYSALVAPSTAHRQPAEILFCGHHARTAATALDAQAAGLYDDAGQPVELAHGHLVRARR